MMRPNLTLLLLLSLAQCGTPAAPPPPAPAPRPPSSPPVAPVAAPAPPAAAPVMELSDKDFVESPSNRDPFRTFLREFNKPVRQVSQQQRRVILPRFALDELRLIAVVSGGTRPRAMFRDPTGLGVAVKRGDFISKNAGKVKQILSDKVVVEIEEQAEDKNTLVDRVIDLHPKENQEGDATEPPRELPPPPPPPTTPEKPLEKPLPERPPAQK